MDSETKTPTPSDAPGPNQLATQTQPDLAVGSSGVAETGGQLPENLAGLSGLGAPPPSPSEPPAENTLQTVANGFRSVLGAVFSWIIFPIVVVLILHNFVFQAYHVLGTSMVPTLHETDYLIISKLGTTTAMLERAVGKNAGYIPARGQVIVFHYPKNPTEIFVKRVVGLPGDRVVIKDGKVTIYNAAHPSGFDPDTSYEKAGTQTLSDTQGELDEIVQPNNIFVLGDNRSPGGSYDSRDWGELPSSYIIGNAVLRLLPLDQVRVF